MIKITEVNDPKGVKFCLSTDIDVISPSFAYEPGLKFWIIDKRINKVFLVELQKTETI